MATRDEEEARARYRYLQLKAKAAAAAESAEPAREEAPPPDVNMLESGLRGARQGATLGFADEIGARIGNWLDRVTGLTDETAALLDEAPAEDGYASLRDDYRADERAAREANPWTYGLSEAAGSMLIPGSTSGSAGRVIGRAIAEGAVAGTGASEGETFADVARSAALGGALAGGVTGGLRGLQGAGDFLSKQRVDTELLDPTRGAGMEFMPLHLADPDGGMGKFYRTTVGRIWGAGGKLKSQQDAFMEAGEAGVTKARETHARLIEDLKREVEDALPEKRIEAEARRQMDSINELADLGAETADSIALQRIAMDAQNFERMAISEALPRRMPDELKETIRNMTPRDADEALRNWYASDGFAQVKNRSFLFDDTLKNNLRTMINGDPALKLEIDDAINQVRKMQSKLGGEPPAPGATPTPGTQVGPAYQGTFELDAGLGAPEFRIDGEALMAMRNVFARRASGPESFAGMAQGRIKQHFDALIVDQLRSDLGTEAAAEYLDELAKWGVSKRLASSVEAARKRGENLITPDDWIRRRGGTDLQGVADETMRSRSALAGEGLKRARDAIKESKQTGKRVIADRRKSDIRESRVTTARRHRAAKVESKRHVDAAKAEVDRLKKSALAENETGLSTLLTTTTVGGASGAAAIMAGAGLPAAVAAIPAGIFTGSRLAAPGAQRAMAGQLPLQRGMQTLGQNEMAQGVARGLRNAVSREAALTGGRTGGQ